MYEASGVQNGSAGSTGPKVVSNDPRTSEAREIVLLCNPRAGGRWKALAGIFDSEEARSVRRIVTDSVEDLGAALRSIGESARLLCVYGGDGTIQRILDRLVAEGARIPRLAFIGGGTMNVMARWCGMTSTPRVNFRETIQADRDGQLLLREVPLLRVRQGSQSHVGFTFGIGPIIRILEQFESGRKDFASVAGLVSGSVAAAWTGWPAVWRQRLAELNAEIIRDGQRIPYDRFSAVFCNVSGSLNPGVSPFVGQRTRDTFYFGAYAVTAREFALMLPVLSQGWRPLDSKVLLRPVSLWRQAGLSLFGKGSMPADPRYVNDIAGRVTIRSPEPIYTIDGEIFHSTGEPIEIELGPELVLAVRGRARGAGRVLKLVQPRKVPPEGDAR